MNNDKRYAEDLEKEAVSWAGSSAVDAFEAGAQWQKEQMLNDAVPGEITNINSHFNDIVLSADEFHKATAPFKDGDKVKVIIIKED